MSWECPKCNSENADYIIDGIIKTECLCGYKMPITVENKTDNTQITSVEGNKFANAKPDNQSTNNLSSIMFPTFIDMSKKLSHFQKKIIVITMAAILFVIAMAIADEVGTYQSGRGGPFNMKKTWYIWVIYFSIIMPAFIMPSFIVKYLDNLSKKFNHAQKKIIGITVAAILFVITMAIADEVGTYQSGRGGPFNMEKTWYIWVIYFSIIGYFEFKLFGNKNSKEEKSNTLD